MRLTVLGGCGAWPAAGQACSGFLVEQDGFRLLLDVGYATVPRLLSLIGADQVDAVFVSHAHIDHCADIGALLRARRMGTTPVSTLPVYALADSLTSVLALDASSATACTIEAVTPGSEFHIGPFAARTWSLPHWVPNVGVRLAAGGNVLAYTGDTGPSPALVELARGADLYLAEATLPDDMPASAQPYSSTAVQAGTVASQAGVGRLVLTHLWPDSDPAPAKAAAAGRFDGPVDVATGGLAIDLG